MVHRTMSLVGFVVFAAMAWGMSEDRRRVNWRVLAAGSALQWALAMFVLWVPPGRHFFEWLGDLVNAVIAASDAGAAFLFGRLVSDYSIGAVVAFKVLPIVIFVSALAGLLYHWGVVQAVIKGMAWAMRRSLRISGLEALGTALFVFFGIETVTGIAGYLKKSTRSEIFTLMTAFMATIASSVMGAYVSFGAEAKHLIAASLMSAPAAVMIAKLMVPETEMPVTMGDIDYKPEVESANSVDALSRGAVAGAALALNIGACLIAFVGTVALVNMGFERAFGLRIETLLGYAMSPFALFMGVPWEEAVKAGELLGIKMVLNEFLAYQRMQGMMQAGMITARTHLISTYALCGFANFGSVAILVGGISTLAPEKRGTVAALGVKALISGTLAAFLTACVAGTLG